MDGSGGRLVRSNSRKNHLEGKKDGSLLRVPQVWVLRASPTPREHTLTGFPVLPSGENLVPESTHEVAELQRTRASI